MGGCVLRFGLSSDPFSDRAAPWRFYYGAGYGVASLRLEQALDQRRGFILVTGNAGTGKTALLRSVLARVDAYACVSVSAAQGSPLAVIEALLRCHEPLESSFSNTRRRAVLLAMIEEARACGRPIVLVVDDAHLAGPQQLEELRLALNIVGDVIKVVQVILVGRPPLTKSLQLRRMAALATRIATRIELAPLSRAEVFEFLIDRLQAAGAAEPTALIEPEAAAAIARHSAGIAGLCMRIARDAFERAGEYGASAVSAELVDEVAVLYAHSGATASKLPLHGRTASAVVSGTALALVLVALVVAARQVDMAVPDSARSGSAGVAASASVLPHFASIGPAIRLAESPLREKFLAGSPYEVRIKPPPRPDQEQTELKQGAEEKKRAGVKQGSAGTKPVSSPAAVGKPAVAHLSLQVGAFRDLERAMALKDQLSRSFNNVYLATVDSGGEPLYRVRVGKFGEPREAAALKRKLQTAGYPSFRVSEP